MKDKIRAIVKRSTEPIGHILYISNDLKTLQRIVGGHVEAVNLGNGALLLCDEDGKSPFKARPLNVFIGEWDAIMGDLVVVGVDGEDFGDVPITMEEWKEMLREWGNQ